MNDTDDRFDRQMLIPGWDQQALEDTRFFVAGAGALGNEVVKDLVMLGARHLVLVDMDLVEESNLNRSTFFSAGDVNSLKVEALKKRVEEHYPRCDVVTHDCTLQELSEEEFSSCDLIFGCVDNQEARFLLNSHAIYYRKPYVDGATDGFLGQVRVVVPPYSSCIECHLPPGAYQDIGKRFSCTREQLEALGLPEEHIPAVPTTTSIISAIATDEALKVLMGMKRFRKEGSWHIGTGSPVNGVLQYDARTNRHTVVSVDKNAECHICGLEGIRGEEDSPLRLKATKRLTLKGLYRQVAREVTGDEPFILTRGLNCVPDSRTFERMADDLEVKARMALGGGHEAADSRRTSKGENVTKEELRVRELKRIVSHVGGQKGNELVESVRRLRSWLRGETTLSEYGLGSGSVLTVVRQSSDRRKDFNLFLD